MLETLLSYITKKVALIGLAVAMVLSLYFYIAYLRSTIETLEKDNATLQIAVQEQQKTIVALQQDFKAIIKAKEEINNKVRELEKKNDDLKDKLFRETQGKTSIEDLILLDKKGRVVKLINKATKKVFRCFEILTGSTLKEEEINNC